MSDKNRSPYSIGSLIALGPAERAIAAYRLVAENPMSHDWLAELLDLSPGRVQQLEAELLLKLRRGLEHEYPRLKDPGEPIPEPRSLPE